MARCTVAPIAAGPRSKWCTIASISPLTEFGTNASACRHSSRWSVLVTGPNGRSVTPCRGGQGSSLTRNSGPPSSRTSSSTSRPVAEPGSGHSTTKARPASTASRAINPSRSSREASSSTTSRSRSTFVGCRPSSSVARATASRAPQSAGPARLAVVHWPGLSSTAATIRRACAATYAVSPFGATSVRTWPSRGLTRLRPRRWSLIRWSTPSRWSSAGSSGGLSWTSRNRRNGRCGISASRARRRSFALAKGCSPSSGVG